MIKNFFDKVLDLIFGKKYYIDIDDCYFQQVEIHDSMADDFLGKEKKNNFYVKKLTSSARYSKCIYQRIEVNEELMNIIEGGKWTFYTKNSNGDICMATREKDFKKIAKIKLKLN